MSHRKKLKEAISHDDILTAGDPQAGEDLHLVALATQAINQAISTPQVNDDYDGQTRPVDLDPDIGADEFIPELIFADGFEVGNTSAWSNAAP